MASKNVKTQDNGNTEVNISVGDIISRLPSMNYSELVALGRSISDAVVTKKDEALADLRRQKEQLLGKITVEGAALGFSLDDIMGTSVVPKYRNPDNANETWSGRGRSPKWFAAHLALGMKANDMLIDKSQATEDEQSEDTQAAA